MNAVTPRAVLHHKIDIVDFVEALIGGDTVAWIALGAIAVIVAFFAIRSFMGQPYVKGTRERRRARERRFIVLWKYERDD